ncbi:MAG: 5-formyltetrahydrofolate cyclo-ligase [Moorea sp. SIO2B7]|nr:5-formyltetrahydrofolate cyclo-ligase [Moorena sp. SIO2B7]
MKQPQEKRELRRILLKKRRSLPEQVWREKSDHLCQQLQSLPLFMEAKTILAYFSFRQEPDLSYLFTNNRRWGFPRCVGKSLSWHFWTPGDSLEIGAYGINEPLPDLPIVNPTEIDLILVPAVACDYQGYRLGYGAGFYDRMLSLPEWTSKPTIGIIFDFAYLPQLPVDSWDRKLDYVCTEKNILSIYSIYT